MFDVSQINRQVSKAVFYTGRK